MLRMVVTLLVLVSCGTAVYLVAQATIPGAFIVACFLAVLATIILYSSSKLDAREGGVESLAVSLAVVIAAVAGLVVGSVIAVSAWQACRLWGWALDYSGDAYCRIEWEPWIAIGILVAESPLVVVAWPEIRKWLLGFISKYDRRIDAGKDTAERSRSAAGERKK